MPDININMGQFVCQSPIINNVTFSGTRYIFNLNWSSQGQYYSTIDPTTTMRLEMEIKEIANSQIVYSEIIDPNADFNNLNYVINIYDYYDAFSNKYSVTFKLTLINEIGCNNTTSYIVPVGTYP